MQLFALNLAKLWLQTYAVLAKSSVELSRHSEVGVVEDAPSDASSDVDLPPLGGTSGDDYSD